ncbi:hypothetical protein ACHQM5_021216 [Ranunculus cassubicifolius]
MAQPMVQVVLLLTVMVIMAEARTPPGIANNPSNARCLDNKYKQCYNLVHVCPKFCPDSCTVHCQSCKPICAGDSVPETPPVVETPPPSEPIPSPPPVVLTPPPSEPTPSPPPVVQTPPPFEPTPSPPPVVLTPPSEPTPSPPPVVVTPPPSEPTPSPPPVVKTPPSSEPTLSPPPVVQTPPPSEPITSPPPSIPTPETPPTSSTPPPPSDPTPSPTPPTPTPSTPPSTPTPSPFIPSPPPKTAKCSKPEYSQCYNSEHVCPSSCPGGCVVDCNSCKPVCNCDKPGSVCQDPKFVGGDGITFYFHGKKGQDFCLLSDSNIHINAHFIGRRNSNMKRDFTWVQSIGLLFDKHQIFIGSQKTSTWDDSIDRLALSFNGEPIFLTESEGAKWKSDMAPGVTFTRSRDTNGVIIEVEGKFKIAANVVPITEEDSKIHNYGIAKEDCFSHLDLGFKFYELSDEVDGVLGKTYRRDYVSNVKMGVAMPVMGGDTNFSSSSLFSTDCKVSRFGGGDVGAASETSEYPSLSCGSGNGGRGVVCKR